MKETKFTEHDGLRDCEVALVTLIAAEDRTVADRVVLCDTPAALIDGHPWSSTLLRRMGESVVVRDYVASFAHSEHGARRVLMLSLRLARMADYEGSSAAAALGTAGWCALSLGRWELADSLALRSEKAKANGLAALIRMKVATQWFAEILGDEAEFGTESVRSCSAEVLRKLTEARACFKTS
jgi:hypothetical protein